MMVADTTTHRKRAKRQAQRAAPRRTTGPRATQKAAMLLEMPYIYAMDYDVLIASAAAFTLAMGVIDGATRPSRAASRIALALQVIVLAAGLWAVLSFSVLGRTGSTVHTFVVTSNPQSGEFFREMFMNVLLYVPFGVGLSLVLSHLFGTAGARLPHARVMAFATTALIAAAVSTSVECWQYFAGTGVAQFSDLVCNVLGAGAGALALPVSWLCARLAFAFSRKSPRT